MANGSAGGDFGVGVGAGGGAGANSDGSVGADEGG